MPGAPPAPLTLPALAQPRPARKKRLLPVRSADFEAASDEDPAQPGAQRPSPPPGPAAPDGLQVSGLSLLPTPPGLT